MQPVALRNYLHAFQDRDLLNALFNTGIFTAFTVTISSSSALGLALFLNRVRFLKRIYRSIFFIPAIVSLVVVSLVWKLILNSEFGLLNEMIHVLGALISRLTGHVPEWTTEHFRYLDSAKPFVPLLTITLVNVWAVIGFNTVIYLAGLQGIPAHLYEVSHIDGATPMEDFRYITLPLLRPTIFFVILMTTIDALQVFVLPNVMNRDSDKTMTIVYYLYRNAFEYYKMGYASAIAYLLFAITVAFSLGLRLTLGRNTRWAPSD